MRWCTMLHAQNTYYGDPTGDGSSSAKWLKEGLAEFIHGGDSRVYSELGENPIDQQIGDLINAIGTGNELGFKRPVRRRLSRRSFPIPKLRRRDTPMVSST